MFRYRLIKDTTGFSVEQLSGHDWIYVGGTASFDPAASWALLDKKLGMFSRVIVEEREYDQTRDAQRPQTTR